MDALSLQARARIRVLALLSACALFLLSGCIGRPDLSPGGVCQSEGEAKPAPDGCNTCTCSDGTWACTEKACVETCEDGETRPSDDGCNACVCQNGEWSCTLALCLPPGDECFSGETKLSEDGCNTCSCSDGQWECTQKGCLLQECENGARRVGESGCTCDCVDQRWLCPEGECSEGCEPGERLLAPDGCNTCGCTEKGQWGTCTALACIECRQGQVKLAEDGCNTCSCTQGHWACTDKACPECQEGDRNTDGCNECTCLGGGWTCTARECGEPKGCGGWLGDTCTENEYCAYTEGQLCGAADASSVCEPRPDICPTVDDPVCGCDGQEYSNACLAAQAGTGVYRSGGCE